MNPNRRNSIAALGALSSALWSNNASPVPATSQPFSPTPPHQGMAARAPLGGVVNVKAVAGAVVRGQQLFAMQDDALRQEIERANLAAKILDRSADSASEHGPLQKAVRSRSDQQDARAALIASMTRLIENRAWVIKDLRWRSVRAEEGDRSIESQVALAEQDLAMSKYLLADSQAQYVQGRLDMSRARWAVEDFEILFPIAKTIQLATVQRLTLMQKLCRISAGTDGQFATSVQNIDAVTRGAVLGYVIADAVEKEESAILFVPAVALQGGLLIKHLKADGEKVNAGDLLCQLDVTDLDLELLNLSFLKKQIERQSVKLHANGLAMLREVANSQLLAIAERLQYLGNEVRRIKFLYEQRAVSIEVLSSAQAAFDMAVIERLKRQQAVAQTEITISSAIDAFDQQRALITLQEADLTRSRNLRRIAAPVSGTVRWLVSQGSYVPAGLHIADLH